MKTETFFFNHFKEYACFCLDQNFDNLCQEYIEKIKEFNGQPLQVLNHLTEDESNCFYKDRLKIFLKSVINGSSFSEIEQVIQNWKQGSLPGNIDKYSIKPSDILLGFAARKNALLNFLPHFTQDINYALLITRELNVFNLLLEEKIFKAYIDIQQELIHFKNEELNKANYALQNQIIERVEIEEKLRREKDFSEAVINNSIDGIFAFDKQLRITAWNKKLEILNGLSKDKVIGKNIFDLFPAYNNTDEGEALKKVLLGETVALSDKAYDNRRGFYEASFVPLLNDKNEIIGGISIIHDTTLRKTAEERLKSRENILKEAQEIAHLGSWEWILRSNTVIWSEELFRIFGYDSFFPEVNRGFLLKHVLDENLDKFKEILGQAIKSRNQFSFELKIQRGDGAIRHIFIKGKVVNGVNHVPHKMMGIAWDITDRKQFEVALQNKNSELEEKNDQLRKAQQELTLANNELELRVEDRTRQLSFINTELNNEISERKKIEEALKHKNEELEKINGDLDNFVYAASHDLKAPISNIEGLIKALPFEIKDASEEGRIILALIDESILRFKETIHDLTEITRAKNQEEDISLINLNELIEEIKLSIKDMIQSTNASFSYEGCDFPQIRFSKVNMKSILFNLISNAIKYSHPDRSPQIHIGCKSEGENIVLWVKDNGLGINSSQHQKIFTMFKRLHNHVDGTGIGLYLVKRIIDNCKGKIEIESEEGVGSTFKIFLNTV